MTKSIFLEFENWRRWPTHGLTTFGFELVQAEPYCWIAGGNNNVENLRCQIELYGEAVRKSAVAQERWAPMIISNQLLAPLGFLFFQSRFVNFWRREASWKKKINYKKKDFIEHRRRWEIFQLIVKSPVREIVMVIYNLDRRRKEGEK